MYHSEKFYGLGGMGFTPIDGSSYISGDSVAPTDSSTPWWASILQGVATTAERVLPPILAPTQFPTYPAIYTPPIIPAPGSPGFPSYPYPTYGSYGTGLTAAGVSTGTLLLIGGGLLLLMMSRKRRAAASA